MLKKKQRLSRSEFETVLKYGKRTHATHFSFVYREAKETKCGLVVGKKIAKKAVERNKLRRKIYSIFGENLSLLQGFHCILLSKSSIKTISHKELQDEIEKLLTSIKTNGKTRASGVE